MGNGYIKLHRELIDSKLWSCSDATLRVALYLLLSANHGPSWHRRIEIGRGQCVRSLTQISEACNLSRKAVRYALSVLAKDAFIRTDEPFGAQQGHRVTICKYDTYQGSECERGTAGAQEGNHEGNTNKKNKNEKEEETPLTPQGVDGDEILNPPITEATDIPPAWQELWRSGVSYITFRAGMDPSPGQLTGWKVAIRSAIARNTNPKELTKALDAASADRYAPKLPLDDRDFPKFFAQTLAWNRQQQDKG